MTAKLTSPLNGNHIAGVCHHANRCFIALGRGADTAQPAICQVLTDRAEGYGLLGIDNGIGKFPGVFHRQIQHMERQTLRRFAADTRQACKLFHQVLQRSGKVFHTFNLLTQQFLREYPPPCKRRYRRPAHWRRWQYKACRWWGQRRRPPPARRQDSWRQYSREWSAP